MEQQMIIDKQQSYVEILEILKYIDKSYINKIPKEIIKFFEENKSQDYKFNYDSSIPLNKQKLNHNTLNLLAMLNLNYWCENEEHKKELISKYIENEKKYQEELHRRYNPDNLFKHNQKEKNVEENLESNNAELVKYKESALTKIINRIKRFFHIK